MMLKPIVLAVSAMCLAMSAMDSAGADKRKDVNALTDAEVKALRDGVAKMMSFDAGITDNADFKPLGWTYQANIHGTPALAVRDAWNSCEHGSFLFLAWHRMEIYFFERILRAASGNAALTVPYWNWDKDAKIPLAFRVRPTGAAPNSLFWQYRRANFNRAPDPANPDPALRDADPLPPGVVTSKKAFEQTAFYTNVWAEGLMKSFGGGARTTKRHSPGSNGAGQLERTPHDALHVTVGLPNTDPDFNKSLGDPGGAGLDPLFWPFHVNMDRAWVCWQKKHPGDAAPTASDAWMKNLVFLFFDVKFKPDGSLDPDGVSRFMTGREIIDTAAQLGYEYDGDPCQDFVVPAKSDQLGSPESFVGVFGDVLTVTVDTPTMLAEEPVTVTIPLSRDVRERIMNLILAGARNGVIILNVGGLAADSVLSTSYGIYLDLPQGAIPSPESKHYAEELALWGIGQQHHRHAQEHHDTQKEDVVDDERSFDITDTVRELIFTGQWNSDALSVTFANTTAVDPRRPGAAPARAESRLRFEYVDLFVQ
jgi:hypothetical protein